MIPNITHSTGSGRYLGYDLGGKKDQRQKVKYLASNGVIIEEENIDMLNKNWRDGDEVDYQRFRRKVVLPLANDLDRQFQSLASLNERPKIKAINISFSYSPDDAEKVDEIVKSEDEYIPLRLMMEREFLREMGYSDCQYFAVEHLGTHCPHDHFAINTILPDGTTINLKYDYVRAQKIAREIRMKYGLAVPNDSHQAIKPKAVEALAESCTMEEFEQNLLKHGIGIIISDHSRNGQGYGLSFTKNKKVIPGSKLDRNTLSYRKVMATLANNLDKRNAQEEAKAAEESRRQEAARLNAENAELMEKYRSIRSAYSTMFPTLKEMGMVLKKTITLYNNAKAASVEINEQTTAKYKELNLHWRLLCNKNNELRNAKMKGDAFKLIGGMIMLLNPIAGLLAIVLADLATDIKVSRIHADKMELLANIQDIKKDMECLKVQQSAIKLDKQEYINQYLMAKDVHKEFCDSMSTVKAEIEKIKQQLTIESSKTSQSKTIKTKPSSKKSPKLKL